jgi:Tol biopolymer transport system component
MSTCAAGASPSKFDPLLLRGRSLAFAQSGVDGQGDVFLASPLAAHPTNLTRSPEDDFSPSWAPDGRRLVFVRRLPLDGRTNNELMLMRADGSGITQLTRTPDNEEDPAWSPDGTKIAFALRYEGLFTMSVGSGAPHRIATATDLHQVRYPTWSPNGSRIAFERLDYKSDLGPLRSSIWVVSASGGHEHRLTSGPTDGSPAWSPTGKTIAFERSPSDCGSSIWTIALSGGQPQDLTPRCPGDKRPAWSWDGKALATLSSPAKGCPVIVIYRGDGTHGRVLLSAAPAGPPASGLSNQCGFSLGLAWQPRPKR